MKPMTREEWRDVVGYEGRYLVSSLGGVVGPRGIELKPSRHRNGYLEFVLYDSGGLRMTHKAHRLVAMAFIPNPSGLPQVNHIDGDKQNNTEANLEWCDQRHNTQHSYDTGLQSPALGEAHGSAKLSDSQVIEIRCIYHRDRVRYSSYALARMFGVSAATIQKIVSGRGWRHVGGPITSAAPTKPEEADEAAA